MKAFLVNERAYQLEHKLEAEDYIDDPEVYALVKETCIGEAIQLIANLRDILEQKQKAEELDLSGLLTE